MSENGQVDVVSLDPRRLEPIIGPDRLDALLSAAAQLREVVGGRRIVNVNSTARGGGVAEMLGTLLGYSRGLGIEASDTVAEELGIPIASEQELREGTPS